jgi:nucleotide-binding universal stress UspA family protein
VAEVSLTAVHALEARSDPLDFRRPLPRAAGLSHRSWRAEIRARMEEEWCAPLDVRRLRLRVEVEDGRAWRVLARAAQRHGADLVAVGQRSRGRLAEALRPGLGWRLVRRSPSPVVIVPARGAPHGPVESTVPSDARSILVACDTAAPAGWALRWSAGLAAELDAELVVARAVDPGGSAASAPPSPPESLHPGRLLDTVRIALEDDCARAAGEVCPRHRAAVLVGKAPSMLLAFAEAEAPALIVLGVDERRHLSRWRPDAVASLLSRRAACPVALVPAGAVLDDPAGRPFRSRVTRLRRRRP